MVLLLLECSGCAVPPVGEDSRSLYHLEKLKKRQLSMLSMDSILAPLINADNQKLKLIKDSCKEVIPCTSGNANRSQCCLSSNNQITITNFRFVFS